MAFAQLVALLKLMIVFSCGPNQTKGRRHINTFNGLDKSMSKQQYELLLKSGERNLNLSKVLNANCIQV